MNFPKMKTEYKKAFSDTSLLVVLTVLPTLFALVSKVFGMSNKPLHDLYGKGEFYLYAISFSGSAYIIYKQLNNDLFKTWGSFIIAFLVFVSIVFTAASLDSESKNLTLIFWSSTVFLFISVPILFHSQILSNKQTPPDVGEYRKDEQQTIQDALK